MCPCALPKTGTGVSMQKELIISSTSQETKLAILEDDELVEFYIERHRSQGIVGNIYKGKVTKVLPGMQSAFVDIGLDRDAFLYVSDFFEDTEEYDKIVSTVEEEVAAQLQETSRGKPAMPPPLPLPMIIPAAAPAASTEEAPEAAAVIAPAPPGLPEVFVEEEERPHASVAGPPIVHDEFGRGGRGRRDRDRRGLKKPKIPSFESKSYETRPDDRTYSSSLAVLPGESLAKVSRRADTEVTEDKNAPLGAVREEPPPVMETAPAEIKERVPEQKEEESKHE